MWLGIWDTGSSDSAQQQSVKLFLVCYQNYMKLRKVQRQQRSEESSQIFHYGNNFWEGKPLKTKQPDKLFKGFLCFCILSKTLYDVFDLCRTCSPTVFISLINCLNIIHQKLLLITISDYCIYFLALRPLCVWPIPAMFRRQTLCGSVDRGLFSYDTHSCCGCWGSASVTGLHTCSRTIWSHRDSCQGDSARGRKENGHEWKK